MTHANDPDRRRQGGISSRFEMRPQEAPAFHDSWRMLSPGRRTEVATEHTQRTHRVLDMADRVLDNFMENVHPDSSPTTIDLLTKISYQLASISDKVTRLESSIKAVELKQEMLSQGVCKGIVCEKEALADPDGSIREQDSCPVAHLQMVDHHFVHHQRHVHHFHTLHVMGSAEEMVDLSPPPASTKMPDSPRTTTINTRGLRARANADGEWSLEFAELPSSPTSPFQPGPRSPNRSPLRSLQPYTHRS
eukprot:NODE_4116_length_839_cov_6.571629_g3958_i0.p1 GENE.NODE_4116_length_839_cov_6.571629_g3958_i0~~NODE_4116_length_839_cov_6.571629_g3958_i0.p1  ORF type:complete len:249 (-),score=38.78 NODE_4116_length_839_cov_6.571629_g3958_i0:66-812(-)